MLSVCKTEADWRRKPDCRVPGTRADRHLFLTALHGATHQNQNGVIRDILSLTLRAIGYADVRFRQSCLGVRIAAARRPG